MLLLLFVFRSVVIAVKAAAMNLLSISAAYGVLVAVAQWGWASRLFGFPEKMPVTTWVPMFLFVILFGLSMDYEVFLLSRIREEYDRSGDNAAAVARGLARTARVITAAAAIMVVVFLSFVLGADVSVKQIGLGLAVAVLVDATVVGSCSARPTGGCPRRWPASCPRPPSSRTSPRPRSGFPSRPPSSDPGQGLAGESARRRHPAAPGVSPCLPAATSPCLPALT